MATTRWTGNALAQKQLDTITVAGTWVQGETITLTINGKDLLITVGANITTTQVALLIKEAVNGTTLTDTTASALPAIADGGGTFIKEFDELTVTSAAAVATFTSDSEVGEPFTLTEVETSTSGTLTPTTSQTPTGPHHADNADNFSNGLPTDSDTLVFDNSDVGVYWGLDQNAVTPAIIIFENTYTGDIGLPREHANGYTEYRDRFLKYGNSGDATNTAIQIGRGDGAGSSRLNLDTGSGQVTMQVYNSGDAAAGEQTAIHWKGTHASNEINVNRGSFGAALEEGDTATIATLRVGYVDSVLGDAVVIGGDGCALGVITQTGGRLVTEDNITTLDIMGGECEHLDGTVTTINGDGGTVFYRSTGTLTTLNVGSGCEFDCTRDMRSRTVTNANLYEGGKIADPHKTVTWTNGIDLERGALSRVELDLGSHITVTPSAI